MSINEDKEQSDLSISSPYSNSEPSEEIIEQRVDSYNYTIPTIQRLQCVKGILDLDMYLNNPVVEQAQGQGDHFQVNNPNNPQQENKSNAENKKNNVEVKQESVKKDVIIFNNTVQPKEKKNKQSATSCTCNIM